MTANELAKYLRRFNGYMDMQPDLLEVANAAADMLEEQEKRIQFLEEDNKSLLSDAKFMWENE